MLKDKIEKSAQDFLATRPDLFLIDLQLNGKAEVQIVVDGDQGVTIKDLTSFTRFIENQVDKEVEDYALNISSFGLSNPLQLPRQFQKNIGRKLQITAQGKQYTGTLNKADDDAIEIAWKERVPKEIGKGKQTKEFTETFTYNQIEKATIIITF